MEEERNRIESLAHNLRHYIDTRWNLLVLNTSDKASNIISSVASILLMAVSMIFVLLFLSIGAALWIGRSVNDSSVGFLYVGIFYLIVAAVLYALRKKLIKIPVMNKLITAMHANENED
jgi:hypothetical protein